MSNSQGAESSPRRLSKLFERFYNSPPPAHQQLAQSPPSPAAPDHPSHTAHQPPHPSTHTLSVDREPVLSRSASPAASDTASGSASAPWQLRPPRWTATQASSSISNTPQGSPAAASRTRPTGGALGALAALSGRAGKGKAKAVGNVEGGYEALEGGASGVLRQGEGDSDEEQPSPLDGEEGVVVDDEACFVDGGEGKVGQSHSFAVGMPTPTAELTNLAHMQTSLPPFPTRSRSTSSSTSTSAPFSPSGKSHATARFSRATTSSGGTCSTATQPGRSARPSLPGSLPSPRRWNEHPRCTAAR